MAGRFLDRIRGRIINGSPSAAFQRFVPVGVVIDSLGVSATPNLITFDNVLQVSPITPVAGSGLWVRLTLTSNAVYTLNVPSGVVPAGARTLIVTVRNTIGGAAGVMTFAAGYKLGAAWVQPATGFSRSIEFNFDGTNYVEYTRSAVDVAN